MIDSGELHDMVRACQTEIRTLRTRESVLQSCSNVVNYLVTSDDAIDADRLTAWVHALRLLEFDEFADSHWQALIGWINGLMTPHEFSMELPPSLHPLTHRAYAGDIVAQNDLPERTEHRKKIRACVLIVEDTLSESRDILAKLTMEYRSRGGSPLFDLTFTTFPGVSSSTNFSRMLSSESAFLAGLDSLLTCAHRSDADQSEFLQAVILDYDLGIAVPSGGTLTAHDVAKRIRAKRPSIDLHLLTGVPFERVFTARSGVDFGRVFSKRNLDEGAVSAMIDCLLQDLQRKYETPFWNALRDVAGRPMITCHTLPLAFGQSIRSSRTLGDLDQYFSQNFFRAETSATLAPLDSLLHPSGTLKKAQQRAAHAFGADRTYFVTNGTSTANKIVLQAVLQTRDAVLVDRNCHISHHYGLALARVRPIYLEPAYLPELGIAGGIPLAEIERGVHEALATTSRPPAAILLTNCTFDGVCVKPASVIRRVLAVLRQAHGGDEMAAFSDLRRIVFLFDEAWFAVARFNPHLIDYTAAASVAALRREDVRFQPHLRVYITQSTHKSLSAIRQGSMIHVCDGVLLDSDIPSLSVKAERRLEQAYHTHTSTSPSATILSSLDVARRQVELEGTYLALEAASHGYELRRSLDCLKAIRGDIGLRALENDDLVSAAQLASAEPGDFILDPTRVTILFPPGITGAEVKRRLFDQYNVQVNKYSHSTVLMNMTIGMTYGNVWSIGQYLWEIAREAKRSFRHAEGLRIETRTSVVGLPGFSGFAQPPAGTDSPLAYYFHNEGDLPIRLASLDDCTRADMKPVCADFITPYPPGYPVLLPGQIITAETIRFLRAMRIEEVHGAHRVDGVLHIPIFDTAGS